MQPPSYQRITKAQKCYACGSMREPGDLESAEVPGEFNDYTPKTVVHCADNKKCLDKIKKEGESK